MGLDTTSLLLDLGVFAVVGVIWLVVQLPLRSRNLKFVNGRIKAVIWRDGGKRHKEVVLFKDTAGISEVKITTPDTKKAQSYVFSKKDLQDDVYGNSFLPFSQVPIAEVNWWSGDPNPITKPTYEDPITKKQTTTPLITSDLLDTIREDDFGAFAIVANERIHELETKLATAYATKPNNIAQWVAAIASVIGVLVTGYLFYSLQQYFGFSVGFGG